MGVKNVFIGFYVICGVYIPAGVVTLPSHLSRVRIKIFPRRDVYAAWLEAELSRRVSSAPPPASMLEQSAARVVTKSESADRLSRTARAGRGQSSFRPPFVSLCLTTLHTTLAGLRAIPSREAHCACVKIHCHRGSA